MLGSAAAFKAAAVGRAASEASDLAILARARAAVHPAPHQGAGRPGAARDDRADASTASSKRPQRQLYDELRAHYRQTLLARISRDGLNRSKIQVLEALLRLRQAACHPAWSTTTRTRESIRQARRARAAAAEVVAEGHKALVFSQFTSFLALLRPRLDAEGSPTSTSTARPATAATPVERFQDDPDCPVFLISLKAGGLGLNLTAAEYVFLLDPWWNPAVEAQAIDRAHRIGQTRHVFAYRLIAKDTVEEKVAELQQTKRDLADAILSADAGLDSRPQARGRRVAAVLTGRRL